MKIFKPLYERALQWAAHPKAPWFLGILSFFEAIIFPVAPEIMLAPMVLAKPERWARYATISLVGSLLGALAGYALGHYAFDFVRPLLADLGWLPRIDAMIGELSKDAQLHPWSAFWTLVLAGFLPVPLKIFTWASGIVGVPLFAFFASMVVGRGKRVFLLAGLIRLGGKRAEEALHRWIEPIGWIAVGLLVAVVIYFKFLR
ncbi:MAG TPA: YqaA family protein [Rhodanobacteraceae bacterium]|nr:YqaA family protein [Rhodanobacteraceae bacterium]